MRYSDGAPLLGYRKGPGAADRRFVTYQKSVTLDRDTDSEFEIASAGYALFRRLWLEGMGVRFISIGVTNIHKDSREADLFEQNRDRQSDLLRGVDVIREKFGNDAVYFGMTETVRNRR